MHVLSDGSTEKHQVDVQIPDHLAGEEARLRMLEKQRKAGELHHPHKSAVSRST